MGSTRPGGPRGPRTERPRSSRRSQDGPKKFRRDPKGLKRRLCHARLRGYVGILVALVDPHRLRGCRLQAFVGQSRGALVAGEVVFLG
eukprot:1275931-Pyramimonas_sp.AAC.1